MSGSLAACTIIARNYLSYARVLAESFYTHEPDGRFYVLIVDGEPDNARAEFDERVTLIAPGDLHLPSFFEMAFKYDVTELCTAVKPALLRLLCAGYDEERVVYFDPDILIMRPLDELHVALETASIVLIPHLLEPIPDDARRPSEQDILIAGAYNLGFIALHRCAETEHFLAWWNERLLDQCRVDPAHGLFVDQRWVDLVPGLFAGTTILRDPTYDVAYWNLHARPLSEHDGAYLVAERPLAFFHFSGFDPVRPLRLSRHQDRTRVRAGSTLAALLGHYALLHIQHGFIDNSAAAYGYAQFDNGVPVHALFRRVYLGLDTQARLGFGDPFSTQQDASFFQWAIADRGRGGRLSPFLECLYASRPDLGAAFPDVAGAHRQEFLSWAGARGAREMGYSPALVNAPHEAVSAGAPLVAPVSVNGMAHEGINVCGYLRNETGLGAVTRGYISALRELGVPLALRDFGGLSPNRSNDPAPLESDPELPYPINFVCVNADQHFVVMERTGEAFFKQRYTIGLWFWELSAFPAQWHDRFAYYDEIWAASSFIANTLAPIAPIPVVYVPPVLVTTGQGSRQRGRERLGVTDDELMYLFVFDFRSYAERKNPLGLIEAFKQAFRPTDRVRLVIKTVNANFDPGAFAELRAAARGMPVALHNGYWSADEMHDLMAACDCYVSLHRSEGLGLTMADALSLGKPVIATNWSGNTDFVTEATAFPVRFELTPLADDVGPYHAGQMWAEPSIEHAAEQMRLVRDHPRLAEERGRAGQRLLLSSFSPAHSAQVIERRLAAIAERRRARHLNATTEPAYQPPLVPAMDVRTSIYGWPGVLAKRVVHALLSYHRQYQQGLNFTFAAHLRRLGEDQQLLGHEVRRLSERLERLEHIDADGTARR